MLLTKKNPYAILNKLSHRNSDKTAAEKTAKNIDN